MQCNEIRSIITKFIHDEVGETGRKNVVIGLSGGIDSSVVATLAVEALGKDQVVGILMPSSTLSMSSYTANDNYADAKKLAESLGIKSYTIPTYSVTSITPEYFPDDELRKIRFGNFIARIRMAILYDRALATDAIVLGTTNKTEMLLGYFTKYGDGGVDIEPIVDLYKTEVFKLAKYIGIPEKIINKPPSANLWDDQTDEGELGLKYEEMDQILWWMDEEDYNIHELRDNLDKLTSVHDPKVLERIVEIMTKNYHKTHMPIGCGIPDSIIKSGHNKV